jgi:hypothetical protein
MMDGTPAGRLGLLPAGNDYDVTGQAVAIR